MRAEGSCGRYRLLPDGPVDPLLLLLLLLCPLALA
jgi:hypothetical protein